MKFNSLVEHILLEANGLNLVSTLDLNTNQLQMLQNLLDDADNHPEFSGGGYVKGQDKDKQRVVALLGDEVIGFMTPRYQPESGYWRSGAIYVKPIYQGKGYASIMLQSFFNNPKHLPARVWIANYNVSSQKAFGKAGFVKSKQRNLSDAPNDHGYDWIKE
jgi:RimJ/RimL family protein N-acetyltransferase